MPKGYIGIDAPFYWGAATSSHQVEGGNDNDWTEWERANANRLAQIAKRKEWPEFILKNYPDPLMPENYISGEAADHYNRFREDFDIAKKLGHNAHRFSLEWSRIEPEQGAFDKKAIEHYRKVAHALRERGIEPFVTLWHWPIPLWLRDKGGWQCRRTPDYFARYAEKAASAMKSDVRFWITLNEPEIYASNSYLKGVWPPQRRNVFLYVSVLNNLARAHRRAYGAVKAANGSASVGIAKNNIYFEAYRKKLANRALKRCADWWWNSYFLNKIKAHQDFIGLNHYFHNRIEYGFNKNANGEVSDMGWEIYPESIYHALKDLARYGKPIYVTENGLADARDAHRARSINDYVKQMLRAKREGVDVRGYFYWSLLDNFEWDKGFWPRFGLVEVDYRTLERKIRPSAQAYKKLIEKEIV